MSIIDYILYFLIIIVALELLFTITNDNEENFFIIADESGNPLSSKVYTMSIIDEDNDDNYYELDEAKLSNLGLPPLYDLEELIKKCGALYSKFNSCFLENNENNEKCQKLIEKKINEFEKCELISSRLSSIKDIANDEYDKLFINEDFNFNLNDININRDNFEFLKRMDIQEIYNEEDEKEKKEAKKKKEAMFEEIIEESSILNNDKDCIEYELSEEDNNIIKCVKYE